MKVRTTSENGSEALRLCVATRPGYVLRRIADATCEFQPHSHTTYVVTVVLAGRLRAQIGESRRVLGSGGVALTNLGAVHGGRTENADLISVGISAQLVGDIVSELGLLRIHPETSFPDSFVRDDLIASHAETLVEEMSGRLMGREAMLDALVRQLVIHLLRTHATVRRSSRVEFSRVGPVDRRLRRAIEYMHDNYSSELNLDQISSAAYMSEFHFARVFKQVTGLTPHVYLANLRLERARELLVETTLAIGEVALRVGYQSQSHFTKVFRSVTGVTPGAYREGVRIAAR